MRLPNVHSAFKSPYFLDLDAMGYGKPTTQAPTHNLTLTRTAAEIVELHAKLADSDGSIKLPKLPIDASTLSSPPKRKSTFLNTLSRLASPSSNKVGRQASLRVLSNPNFGIATTGGAPANPTPVVSPSQEVGDPFASLGDSAGALSSSNGNTPSPAAGTSADKNTMMTSLAAYLTTIANEPALRQTRAWKRFVRVRTDDLESVRAERAIKRVRSDLAVHVGSGKSPNLNADEPVATSAHASSTNVSSSNVSELLDGVESVDGIVDGESKLTDGSKSILQEGIKEEEEDVGALFESPVDVAKEVVVVVGASRQPGEIPDEDADASPVDQTQPAQQNDADIIPNGTVEEEVTTLPTPVADGPTSRIPRSHSADPSRVSRRHTSSAQDGTSSATGDESSISTTADLRECKKRSQSTDPNRKKKSQRKVAINDFEMMRVLGKGCAGKVLLVRHKESTDLYALKAITKRHVLAHQELQHTLTEQAVLKRMAKEGKDPFVVKLWWSFHDKENLFLVMDFHPGGDLATQLARWGRLGRDRARFYAAEIVEGVEGLHAAGVIYRDLKPENILIGADGHIVLTDFGLSKEFPRRVSPITAPPTPSGTRAEFYPEATTPPWMKGGERDLANGWPGQSIGPADTTTTFCGTAEYLAPEVIQGLPYSYEVDWWSFGTMLYEMLTGITPFWANNHSDMYVRVLQDELQFPEDRAMDQDTKSLIRGLLQRNPALRICEPRIKRHPYFSMIDWSHVYYKRYIPPYIPPIDPLNASDTQNFDDTFLDMEPILDDPNEHDQTDTDQDRDQTDAEPTDGEDAYPTPSHSRSPSVHPNGDNTVDVFDGYSFKGRYSVLVDDGEQEGSGDSGEEETDEDDLPSVVTNTLDVSSERAQEILESPVGVDEQTPESEPKTPEARPQPLLIESQPSTAPSEIKPSLSLEPVLAPESLSTPRTSKDIPTYIVPASPKEAVPPLPAKDGKPKATRITAPPTKTGGRTTRGRREKSGVAALDRFLSDGGEGDGESTEKDEEDDDWDIIEADGEDRNGAKGNSLFARGVVDRYRLAVFRKASTPSQRIAGRSFSGLSKESELHTADPADSPSPSDKQRRGRLKFRRTPKPFLRGKSPPPSSHPTKNGSSSKTPAQSTINTTTVSSMSSTGLLTPSASTMPIPPSLKSKESVVSVGEQSVGSDQSNGDTPCGNPGSPEASKIITSPTQSLPAHAEEPEKLKSKKLKKYKENAEKVLSLFASPR
ncbi:hypothetical protein V8B97DRAFT_1918412 [Scleroderma yunnanense]